jgi:hypothetical protein
MTHEDNKRYFTTFQVRSHSGIKPISDPEDQ